MDRDFSSNLSALLLNEPTLEQLLDRIAKLAPITVGPA